VIDSQSVKAPASGAQRGYDAGKKIVGRKRHIAVDTDGRLLMINLTPADISDSAGAQADWAALARCLAAADGGPQLILKIVVFDETDYAWARSAAERYPNLPLYLQPGNPDVDPDAQVDPRRIDLDDEVEIGGLVHELEPIVGRVSEQMLDDPGPARQDAWREPAVARYAFRPARGGDRSSAQLHLLLWGNKRGV
jgi:hypothetical protein